MGVKLHLKYPILVNASIIVLTGSIIVTCAASYFRHITTSYIRTAMFHVSAPKPVPPSYARQAMNVTGLHSNGHPNCFT